VKGFYVIMTSICLGFRWRY